VRILKGSAVLLPIYAAFKDGRLKLVVNSEILKELAAVLSRPRLHIDRTDIKELFRLIKLKAVRFDLKPSSRLSDACRDPKDNFILELAIQADADFIVTGDKDLLVLNSFRGIPIITPKAFIGRLNK
jgi:hypothetical protein